MINRSVHVLSINKDYYFACAVNLDPTTNIISEMAALFSKSYDPKIPNGRLYIILDIFGTS